MKILPLAMAALLMMSCAHKSQQSSCNQSFAAPSVVWIEDKPGPSFQDHHVFPSVPDSLWQAVASDQGVASSMSCLILFAEGDTILVDAGLGAPFSMLMPRLQEMGIQAELLRHIFITHLHPDHIGGLLRDGQKTFPNADVWINAIEAKAWQEMEGERAAMPQAVLAAYANQMKLFQAGDTLPGKVLSIPAYGHTTGHTVFQKDSILIIADLLHGADLQLAHPEFCPFFDMDPQAATEARIRILDYARQQHLTMYGMHLPAPGCISFHD